MEDKRVVILPASLVGAIDECRGDLSRADFINVLLERALSGNQEKTTPVAYVTRQELEEFERSMRSLLRSFLEFFVTYGLELGPSVHKPDLSDLPQKLREMIGLEKSRGLSEG